MTPGISVVTIAFDAATTISRTIESVLAQKNETIEYLVVDGASEDDTMAIVERYGESIDVVVSEPDEGIADAFNKGISRASGDIVGLINADDRLLPGCLEKVVTYFEENPDCQVLHGDVLLYKNDRYVKRIKPAPFWWCPWRLVLFNHPATFVRREVYKQHGGFDLKYRIAMDVDIFERWKSVGIQVDYLPLPLVKMHAGGISGVAANKGYSEVRDIFIHYGRNSLLANINYWSKVFLNHLVG